MSALPRSSADQRARREAAIWLVKHDRGLTAGEQDEFFQWLAAGACHGAWFARHRSGWVRLDGITAWRPEHSADPNPDVLARPARRRRTRRVLVAVAGLALLAGVGAWFTEPAKPEPFAAVAGGYERRAFDDGSVAGLNRGAEIDVHFTTGERRIVLRQGEALFTVAKDERRPFVVRAHGVDVRAVGTAFAVKLGSASVELLVTEGRVQVAGTRDDAAGPASLVVAGQRARIALHAGAGPSTEIGRSTAADLERLNGWQPLLLDFSSTPLADVLAEFNRRNRLQLRLGDPSLGSIPIVASIRSDNIEGFVRLVATTARLRAERRGDYEIVLRPASAD